MADDLARVDALIDELLADARPDDDSDRRVPRRAVRPRPRVGALPRGLRRPRTRRRACSATSTHRLRAAGARAPHGTLFFGLSLAGPTVATHGSDELRPRALRPMFTGEEIWCQLFSEPGAGSDLAGLVDARGARRRRVGRERPEGVEHARAPRRPRHARRPHRPRPARSTRASPTSWSTCTRPASRCGRCARSPVKPSSTRCTSPTSASRTPIASATSATAGASR